MAINETTLVRHELKCEQRFFQPVRDRLKTAELRLNDRGFKVGHQIKLNEVKLAKDQFDGSEFLVETGRWISATITHIVDSNDGPWLADGYVMLSFNVDAYDDGEVMTNRTKELIGGTLLSIGMAILFGALGYVFTVHLLPQIPWPGILAMVGVVIAAVGLFFVLDSNDRKGL